MLLIFFVFSLLINSAFLQQTNERPVVKFLMLIQNDQDMATEWLVDTLKRSENNVDSILKYNYKVVKIDVSDAESFTNESLCQHFMDGYPIVLDLTWQNSNWMNLYQTSKLASLPYFKMDITLGPSLRILDSYLKLRNATDVTVILEDQSKVHEALYYWVDKTSLRMLMMEGLDETSAERLNSIRPLPSFYVVIGNTQVIQKIVKMARDKGLMKLSERWVLLFLDMDRNNNIIKQMLTGSPVSLIYFDKTMCCLLSQRNCDDCPTNFEASRYFFISFIEHLTNILNSIYKDNNEIAAPMFNCTSDTFPIKLFTESVNATKYSIFTKDESNVYSPYFNAYIEMGKENQLFEVIARYNDKNKIKLEEGVVLKPIKKFFKVGTALAIPWTYRETDPNTKQTRLTGYCVDFTAKLAEVMNFDYELVIPKTERFGKRDSNGKWDGTVGDLVRGDTDIIVGALTMTAEREEVIDFVAPYFEQTGISIVMRKPVRKTSLFKFMTVLRLEVWLSIVAALVVTGFMIWILDKYSPYSARNNAKAYPYPCRKFTLKESFWFALTSFTPQGGGEAPKALSGRTLVAAYWLFVVLMLATFTANLAAFLTVERMQSPVQSLEQLAKQSRINYTVMKNSWSHQYFINMKFAEDTLYRLWKELTLNASTDQTQYRVWDYPIREQYGHILLAINDSMPVENATEGFREVVDHIDADFAFIHDSSEIKYEISRNCNLTEIGEVFAERPYAVAVQQGSYMSDEISKAILDLQKERFFEGLKAKYWNNSVKGVCPDSEDSEGITLESLGGVFIATLFGLALAMLTLLVEVIYYKKKRPTNKVTEVKPSVTKKLDSPKKKSWFLRRRSKKNDDDDDDDNNDKFNPQKNTFMKEPPPSYMKQLEGRKDQVTIGSTFQPVLMGKPLKPASEAFTKGNYFTVYSRPPIHQDNDNNDEWNWQRNYLY